MVHFKDKPKFHKRSYDTESLLEFCFKKGVPLETVQVLMNEMSVLENSTLHEQEQVSSNDCCSVIVVLEDCQLFCQVIQHNISFHWTEQFCSMLHRMHTTKRLRFLILELQGTITKRPCRDFDTKGYVQCRSGIFKRQ